MAIDRRRFVLLCQQTLALAVVAAFTVPAASLVNLDMVDPPGAGPVAAHAPGR
jgi:hypothetical protein